MTEQPRRPRTEPVDPRLDAVLRHAIAIGVVLVLLLPAARGNHATLGWLPLWLLAMPLVAWWALHRFALPGWLPRAPVARIAVARRSVGGGIGRPLAARNRYGRPPRRMAAMAPSSHGSRASG